MSSRSQIRFAPSVESLDERVTPSRLTGSPPVPAQAAVILEGQQCLVFTLGGIPSRADGDMVLKGATIHENSVASIDGNTIKIDAAHHEHAGNVFAVWVTVGAFEATDDPTGGR